MSHRQELCVSETVALTDQTPEESGLKLAVKLPFGVIVAFTIWVELLVENCTLTFELFSFGVMFPVMVMFSPSCMGSFTA